MQLPQYSDDEVRVYHPICQEALNSALLSLSLDSDYEVVQHEKINGIIPDFVVKNTKSHKYLLIIEVKRTPSQVASTRYKNQAQSYILEAEKASLEQPYFALTNLEVTNFFKYNPDKTSVNNQLLVPSPMSVGKFSDDYAVFKDNLIRHFKELIQIAYEDKGEYILSYNEIIKTLSKYITDEKLWHSAITVIGYEFILANLKKERPTEVASWNNAVRYKINPKMIQDKLGSIDFKSLTVGEISKNENDIWLNSVLSEAKRIGEKSWNGDEFSSIAHELLIAGREHEGLVPTDEDLGAALVSLTLPASEYSSNLLVCDPASGSGNLISSFLNRYSDFPSSNLWLNDNYKQFQDILSIRFGLRYSNTITPSEAPKITSDNIIDISQEEFSEVDVVLMNPPYLSGVKDPSAKDQFIKKIEEHTNQDACTNVGQMPLEGPFLELLLSKVKNGTKIGLIYPESHLFAKGKEAIAIRKLLLEKFGLKKIFTYPRAGLFSSVTKGTVVLIGEKNKNIDDIEVLSSYVPLEDLDLKELEESDDPYGINSISVSRTKLSENIEDGWKFSIFPEYENLIHLLNQHVSLLGSRQFKRGQIGNEGGTDYIFPNKLPFWEDIEHIIPDEWLIPAIENTKDTCHKNLNQRTVTIKGLKPPEEAFEENTLESETLKNILDTIDEFRQEGSSQQIKKIKSRKDIISILKRSSNKVIKKGSILVPRFLRKEFKLYKLEEDMFVSSNFVVITPKDSNERRIIESWLYSIFGQLQLEYLTKPQEGGRKMELGNLSLVKFPSNNILTSIPVLNRRYFTDFSETKDIDIFWQKEMNISDEDLLRFQGIMHEIVSLRNP